LDAPDGSDNPRPNHSHALTIAMYINFDMIPTKPLRWLGDSLERVREFTPEARARVGFELWEVQRGKEPTDWKPMCTVGVGSERDSYSRAG